MRLWHYRLIPTLSRQNLLGQWRECLAITGAISKNGEVNHATVNRLNDYPIEDLEIYIELVKREMNRRGYNTTERSHQKLKKDIGYDWNRPIQYEENGLGDVYFTSGKELFEGFHNKRYLWQNLYMMQEKADTDQLTQAEWQAMLASLEGKYPEVLSLR
ncbi:pyrimidine dimer DNA glycosylase/endonuclease V [Fructobacillus durionis]|uniref:Pyrimidine dimer DNA glycosylase /DNA-(Apurinic or apyrimidinic site) lyase n=1 Tax=Fructobacillus durionis TaxID=283737 RepID=A0A1I1FQ77_9LACO|nr:pyrimidine dimer DNA glycosylase/endonuclease V [Fructobacillus durionis]SFB99233.1 Pyrimidine dimer DNA glycosylase /DNA-(apurinic or apyrimidinic site) lyase [Fructobacillus durionis]